MISWAQFLYTYSLFVSKVEKVKHKKEYNIVNNSEEQKHFKKLSCGLSRNQWISCRSVFDALQSIMIKLWTLCFCYDGSGSFI